jgi:uncharacterized protein (TIGR02266 family)
MIPDTRKDPRAKVLSMTVRYKSATIDEFIEHHSHDVSRGGMFIKTPSPFPPGTLLKFEVRIADEQKVMQGVGRVVWKREASSAAVDSPSGMGVKFIKLDDDSKGIIDRLVGKRGTAEGAYDAGERVSAQGAPGGADAPTPAGGTPVVEKPIPMRKGTMIGLGAVKLPEAGPKAAGGSGAFFPDSEPANLPAPEDRTVMRQAAELLRDALREAGGSMEEIGSAGAAPVAGMESKAEGATAQESAAVSSPKPSDPPAATAPERKIEPAAARSERPAAKPAPSRSEPPRESIPVSKPAGGSKSALWMVLGVIVIGGGIFFVTQGNKPAEPAPELPAPASAAPPAEPAAVAPPVPAEIESAAAPEPSAAPSAAPVPETPAEKAAREKAEAAAQKAEAEAAKKAEADAKKAEAEAKKAADLEAKKAAAEARKAEADAKKAADAEAQKAARAAAAARASSVMRSAPVPAEKPVATTPTPAPAAPSPAAPAEKPAAPPAAEKPAPAPKAAAPKAPAASKPSESDNPY